MDTKTKKGLFIAIGSLTIALSAMKTNKMITSYNYKKEKQTEITNMLDKRIITTDLGTFNYIELYKVTTTKNQYLSIIGNDGQFYDIFSGNMIETMDETILYYSSLYEDIYTSLYNGTIKWEDVNQDNIINSLIEMNNIVDNTSKRRI